MSEYHFPVPGAANEEEVVLFVRKHWASFIGQFLLSFLMLVVPAVILIVLYYSNQKITGGLVANFLVLGMSIYYLITVTVAFVSWVSFYNDIYVVCRDSIIDVVQEGFWGRKISQVSLLRVQDVSSNIEGFLPTIFGYGDVLVETAGEQTQNFLLKSIPNPQEVSAKILELHHAIIAKEERVQETKEGEGVLRMAREFDKEQTHRQHPMPSKSPLSSSEIQTPLKSSEIQPIEHIEDEPKNSNPEFPSRGRPEEINNPNNSGAVVSGHDQLEMPKDDNTAAVSGNHGEEGEISKNDLDKGGEIDLHENH